MTTVLVNDIDTVCVSFRRNLGNGVSAASDLAKIMHSVVSSRDTNIFGREYNKVVLEKRDAAAAKIMVGVLASIFPGARKVKDKNDPRRAIFKIADCVADEDALARMDEAVANKVSLRADFAALIRGEKKERPAFDPKATAERLVKAHKDSPADIDQLIAALQAARQKMVVNGEPNH